MCLKCAINCKTCSGGAVNNCSECSSGYFLDSSTNICVSCNGDLEYKEGVYCKPCHSSCQRCNDGLATSCTLCKTTLYFKEGLCETCS